jgi:isocitrate dehydrogenase (NAD+)
MPLRRPDPGSRPHRVTLFPGDGIGPEVMSAARMAIDATGVEVDWDVQTAGAEAHAATGAAIPDAAIESVRDRGVALKGPLSASTDGSYRAPNVALRDALGLEVGIRPCRALPGTPTRFEETDLVLVRMLRDDLYAGIEFEPASREAGIVRELARDAGGREVSEDSGISIKPLSPAGAGRAIATAFEFATLGGREAVTAVHKASVMRQTDGLFLDVARRVAASYPAIRFRESMVDSICNRLVIEPSACDVLVAPMMYGDILADIGAGLIGGLGMAPGANYGVDCAVFEPVHGSAPRHAGEDRANPMAAILSGAMLLRYLGEDDAADRLEDAVAAVVAAGETLTYDLRRGSGEPPSGTAAVGEAVADAVRALG